MKLLRLPFAAAMLWLASSSAYAIPTLWSDEFNPSDILLNANGATVADRELSFTLDIRPGSDGFRPGIDSLDQAELTIWLYDDFDLAGERVSFNFDSSGWTPTQEVNGFSFFPDLFSSSPLGFLTDGVLNVVVRATQGDFRFDRASLIAIGEQGVAIPEPTSVALFGIGLLGFAFGFRRFLDRKST